MASKSIRKISRPKKSSVATKNIRIIEKLQNDSVKITVPFLTNHKLSLANSDIIYASNIFDSTTCYKWYSSLCSLDTWYQPIIKVYGHTIQQSRQIASYSRDKSLNVDYSNTQVETHFEYPPVIEEIQKAIEEISGTKFNYGMLIYTYI